MALWPRRSLFKRRSGRSASGMRRHPLLGSVFDPEWYATRYRDVFRFDADPVDHFLRSGIREGRDPSPYVDLSFYATQVSFAPESNVELVEHLLEVGLPTGLRTSPYVDLGWYASQNHDAPSDPLGAFQHLVSYGAANRRDPSPFVDLDWYQHRYRDTAAGGLDPFAYFVALGGPLGRYPHPLWDEDAYRMENEYVRFALSMGKYLHGFEHFCAVGSVEVARGFETLAIRIDGTQLEYSEDRYLAENPDVADGIRSGAYQSGVSHLFATGHREVGRGSRHLGPPSRRSRISIPSRVEQQSDSLMVMVHFDPEGVVDPHVLLAIDTFAAFGIDVCAVTVGVNARGRASLEERCSAVLVRDENDDLRDFGAWSLALDALGDDLLDRYERIILANDSAYFPACDPTSFLLALREQSCDVWGASDSLSGGRYHLQSFFLALSREGRKTLLPELARRVKTHPSPTKLSLIQHFEVGLSQYALEQGLSLGAFCSVKHLAESATPLAELLSPPDARPLSPLVLTITNQMHHFWRAAIRSRLPFLKVELLRDNPLDVDLLDWENDVDGAPCSAEMIRGHLNRVAPAGWAGGGRS